MTWRIEYESNPQVTKLAAQFSGYTTVDWPKEYLLENQKYYQALKQDRIDDELSLVTNSISSGLTTDSAIQFISKFTRGQLIKSRLWSSLQSWIVLTFIGVTTGTIAALLNVMTEWLNDLKRGHCQLGFFYNESFCCIKQGQGQDQCTAFQPWSNHILPSFLIHTILCISFGLIASLACTRWAPFAAGSGISEVKCIVSGFNKDGFLSLMTLIIKASMLPFTIASGLAVGKEGPSVHYAACVGSVVPPLIVKWFKDCPTKMSDFITAASASGVAVAFGSPISGVLFALEEICNRVSLGVLGKSFYAAFIATSTLQAWNPFGTGQIVMFEVKYNSQWNWWEFPLFMLLGIFGGIYGVVVSKMNIKYVAFRRRYLSKWGWQEVGVLCGVTAIIGYSNPYIRLDMTKVMELLFDECKESTSTNNAICAISNDDYTTKEWVMTLIDLTSATILRIVLICISYGSKVPCGIFVPSMAVGATFGKFLGLLIEQIHPNGGITSGIYAFLGAGAALSGITGLTVTVVVIMFELTGALKYIVPMMVVVIFVKIVYEAIGLGFGGIADQMIKFNGMPYLDLKEEHHLGDVNTSVGDVMLTSDSIVNNKLIYLYNGMSIRELKDILSINDFKAYPIVYKDSRGGIKLLASIDTIHLNQCLINQYQGDEEGEIIQHENDNNNDKRISFISDEMMHRFTGELNSNIESDFINLQQYIDTELLTIFNSSSIYKLLKLFMELGVKFVYIIDNTNYSLLGIVSRKDMIKYDNYCYWKGHGDVFINEGDELLFSKLWQLYQGVGQFVLNVPFFIRNWVTGSNSTS